MSGLLGKGQVMRLAGSTHSFSSNDDGRGRSDIGDLSDMVYFSTCAILRPVWLAIVEIESRPIAIPDLMVELNSNR